MLTTMSCFCCIHQIYLSKKWGFTKFQQADVPQMIEEGKLTPDGVNFQYRPDHGPLDAWKRRMAAWGRRTLMPHRILINILWERQVSCVYVCCPLIWDGRLLMMFSLCLFAITLSLTVCVATVFNRFIDRQWHTCWWLLTSVRLDCTHWMSFLVLLHFPRLIPCQLNFTANIPFLLLHIIRA